MPPQPQAKWQDIATRKQKQREEAIPPTWRLKSKPGVNVADLMDVPRSCGILSARELEITERDATRLVELLAKSAEGGEGMSSLEVTTAFCKRAAVCHQVTNCLTEIFFDEALTRAKHLDAYLRKHNKPMGPLHGLPISLKDSFAIIGHDTSIGIASLCFAPATTNSTLVTLLLAAGAVLYCKTNIPQTLMALDSHNNVFGRTLNPANTKLTAGGSSGGEGVLVAMCGSPLGVGTDVGGSIRIPAMCNGVFGIKPSHGRVPFGGQRGTLAEGAEAVGVRASAGPIARSLRDLDLFMRVMGQMEAWKGDEEVVAQGWDHQISLPKGKLRVGVVRWDGVTRPMPPVANFLSAAVRELRKSGNVQVVEMDVSPILSKCQRLFNALTGTDGGNHVFDMLDATGEPLSPWLRSRVRRGEQASLAKIGDLHAQRTKLQTEFLKIWRADGGYWKDGNGLNEVDVIICPVAPHTTPPIDAWNTASYTSSFVLLDYPAATLPVVKVKASDLKGEIEGQVVGNWDKANRKIWNETEKGVWLGGWHCLQVVGRRREDRVVLEAMAVLDEALQELKNKSSDGEKARL